MCAQLSCYSYKEFSAKLPASLSWLKPFPTSFFLHLQAILFYFFFSLSFWFFSKSVLMFFLLFTSKLNAHFPLPQFSRGMWTQLCGKFYVVLWIYTVPLIAYLIQIVSILKLKSPELLVFKANKGNTKSFLKSLGQEKIRSTSIVIKFGLFFFSPVKKLLGFSGLSPTHKSCQASLIS